MYFMFFFNLVDKILYIFLLQVRLNICLNGIIPVLNNYFELNYIALFFSQVKENKAKIVNVDF